MTVHQLARTIHTDDFHDKVYNFPVDSVLHTESAPGKLLISASTGYLLSSPQTEQPRRELSVPYQQQADGSWAAHSIITLLGCEKELIDGLVRIQNPIAGTSLLTIQAESTALARVQKPLLTISELALTFPSTSPGIPKFAVLTITQQYTDESVTISSDAPDYFQLASDKHPNYSHTLTLKPALIGTYVHVRYLSNKAGRHEGQLIVQSTYDEKMVTLQGRSAGLLPVVRPARPAYAQPERTNSPSLIKKSAVVVSSVLILGLAWLGYTNRAKLTSFGEASAPSGQSIRATRTVPPAVEQTDKASNRSQVLTPPEGRKLTKSKPVHISPAVESDVEPTSDLANRTPTAPTLPSAPTVQKSTSQKAVQNLSEPKETTREISTKQPNNRAKSSEREEESELEKTLNQSPPN